MANNLSWATVLIQQGLVYLDMLTPPEYDEEELGIPDMRREDILDNSVLDSRADVPGRQRLWN